MSAPLTVGQIRFRYPAPTAMKNEDWLWESPPDYYCVGGALCAFLGYTAAGFPSIEEVAYALLQANPDLLEFQAERFAAGIACENDHERFEDAWRILDEALTA